jgi:hypothetical protein
MSLPDGVKGSSSWNTRVFVVWGYGIILCGFSLLVGVLFGNCGVGADVWVSYYHLASFKCDVLIAMTV